MHNLQKKRKFKKLLYSRASIILLAVLAVALFRGSWNVYQKFTQSGKDLEGARQELELAKNKESALANSLSNLDTVRGKEEEIRDKFNVTKIGEEVVFVVDNDETNSESIEGEGGVWTKVKSFINNIFGN